MSRRQAAAQPPLPPPQDSDDDDDDAEGELQPQAQVLEAINNNLLAIQEAMVNMAQAVQAATAMGQAATAAANAAAAAIQPLPVQPAENPAEAAVPFVRTPFGSGTATVMDLNTKEGRKQYKDAAVSIFPVTEKFDV